MPYGNGRAYRVHIDAFGRVHKTTPNGPHGIAYDFVFSTVFAAEVFDFLRVEAV